MLHLKIKSEWFLFKRQFSEGTLLCITIWIAWRGENITDWKTFTVILFENTYYIHSRIESKWLYNSTYYDRLNKIYSSNIQNYIMLYNTVLLNISVQMSLESENKSVNKQICIIHLYTLSAKISNEYQHAYWEKVAKTILFNVDIRLYFLKLQLKEFS